MRPLWGVLALAVAAGSLAWTMQTGNSVLGPIGAVLSVWLIGGAVVDLLAKTGRGAWSGRLARMRRLPRADWGRVVAHGGLGVCLFGIAGMMAWEAEDIRVTALGETFEVAGYQITLNRVDQIEGPNYFSTMADFTVARNGRTVARLFPEKRLYPVSQMPTTEAAIDGGVFRDIYLVIGDRQSDGTWAVRSYVKPLASWIWAGAILMALGGLLSLTDRRYRVAAGARRAAKAVPAE